VRAAEVGGGGILAISTMPRRMARVREKMLEQRFAVVARMARVSFERSS